MKSLALYGNFENLIKTMKRTVDCDLAQDSKRNVL